MSTKSRFSSRVNLRITDNDASIIHQLQELSPGSSMAGIIRQALKEKFEREVPPSPTNNLNNQ